MKKLGLISIFLGAALMASTAANAVEIKIGVVNAAQVLDQSPQKSAALGRLEQEFSARSKSLDTRAKGLIARQQQFQKNSATLGGKERQTQERDLVSAQRDLKRLQDEFSEDLAIRRNEELRKLETKIAKTIVDLAKREGFDLMVYQGVIFASDKVDVTARVLALLKSTP